MKTVSFNPKTNKIEIPTKRGVRYLIDGEEVRGSVKIDGPTTVTAEPKDGCRFVKGAVTEWTFPEESLEEEVEDSSSIDDFDNQNFDSGPIQTA